MKTYNLEEVKRNIVLEFSVQEAKLLKEALGKLDKSLVQRYNMSVEQFRVLCDMYAGLDSVIK